MTTEAETEWRHNRRPTAPEWEQLSDTAWGVLEDAEFEDDAQWSDWRSIIILGVDYKFRWVSLGGGRGQFSVVSPTWDFVSRTQDDTSIEPIGWLTITDEDIFKTNLLALYFWLYDDE